MNIHPSKALDLHVYHLILLLLYFQYVTTTNLPYLALSKRSNPRMVLRVGRGSLISCLSPTAAKGQHVLS